MTSSWEIILIGAGVLAAAIAGGTFFAFSNFVMPALSALSPAGGVGAMQAINRAAPNPVFVTALLFGILAGCPVLVAEIDTFGRSETLLVAAAVGLSAVSLAITLGGNVPKNNRLDKFDADSAGAATYWETYGHVWTRDNTFRGIASLASALMYALSLLGR